MPIKTAIGACIDKFVNADRLLHRYLELKRSAYTLFRFDADIAIHQFDEGSSDG